MISSMSHFRRQDACYLLALWVLFLFCLPSYWNSYFYYDDFNCFYLAQREGGLSLLGQVLNPFSGYFRPFYMLVYWGFWKVFFFNPLPFHLCSWALHLVNLVLIFRLLRASSGSAYAAGLMGLLYAYQLTFREIFFNFTCLGEPLCALLMLAGLHLYFFRRETWHGLIGCSLLYFLALKTKEMAVTLPALLFLFELAMGRKSLPGLLPGAKSHYRQEAWNWLRIVAARLVVPILLTILYLAIKIPDMGRLVSEAMPYSPSHPYFLDFSPGSVLKGYAWYWNVLLGWNFKPVVWLLFWLGMAGWLFWRNNRWGLFWLGFIFVAFVPVIGMVNRRLPYYWYIPFLGVAGMGSQLIAWLQVKIGDALSARFMKGVEVLIFFGVGVYQWQHQEAITRVQMIWVHGLTAENRRFVQTFQTLPSPPHGSHVYFESVPRYFDSTAARSAVQVLFRDTTLNASIVSQCPSTGACCLAVQEGKVIPKRWPGLIFH
jgi:hypothetical protein